jgi:hypothetical protein
MKSPPSLGIRQSSLPNEFRLPEGYAIPTPAVQAFFVILGEIVARLLARAIPALFLFSKACLHESTPDAQPVGMTPSDGSCISQLS